MNDRSSDSFLRSVWAPREISEAHIDPSTVPDINMAQHWGPLELNPLNKSGALASKNSSTRRHRFDTFSSAAVARISESLLKSKRPLIITTYLGRNHEAVAQLVKLVELLAIPVFNSCISNVNIPFDHVSHQGVAYGQPSNPLVAEADFILVLDCDVPWCVSFFLAPASRIPFDPYYQIFRIPHNTRPSPTSEIFHIDCDPLKDQMAFHSFPFLLQARADAAIALEQIHDYILAAPSTSFDAPKINIRASGLLARKQVLVKALEDLESPASNGILTGPSIVASLRRNAPSNTLVLNEAISNYAHAWNHFRPNTPGAMLTSGASSLGWALGAAIGAQLAGNAFPEHRKDLVAVVVGDGSFLFGVPSSSYWIARRYETVSFLALISCFGCKCSSTFFKS